jgi:hypothetical protein
MGARSGLAICGAIAALAVAGCGSGGGQPSWAAGLGKGVTVISPGSASPGHDTPADVLAGVVADINAHNYTDACQYFEPSQQATCRTSIAPLTPANAAKAFAYFATIKPTYTVIDGDQALVGATGTVCDPSSNKCTKNTDPAAVLDSGKPFSQLWQVANNTTGATYVPVPCIKVNGQWYGYESGS